jgi:hypothetical protein
MSELAKLKAISVATDRWGVALSKCTVGRGGSAAPPPCRISENDSNVSRRSSRCLIFPGVWPNWLRGRRRYSRTQSALFYGRLSYASLLLEFHRLICIIFADDRSAGESMARHLSRHRGSRFSAGFYAPGLTFLRVRLASTATRWLTYGELNEVRNCKTNFLNQMRINCWNKNFQGLNNLPHRREWIFSETW